MRKYSILVPIVALIVLATTHYPSDDGILVLAFLLVYWIISSLAEQDNQGK